MQAAIIPDKILFSFRRLFREQYEFIQNDNFGLGSVDNHGYWLPRRPSELFGNLERFLTVCLFR
jgi:hypothetical protein